MEAASLLERARSLRSPPSPPQPPASPAGFHSPSPAGGRLGPSLLPPASRPPPLVRLMLSPPASLYRRRAPEESSPPSGDFQALSQMFAWLDPSLCPAFCSKVASMARHFLAIPLRSHSCLRRAPYPLNLFFTAPHCHLRPIDQCFLFLPTGL